jgi:hypothetical protein
MVGTVNFEARIKELVKNSPDLAVLVEPLLVVRRLKAWGRADRQAAAGLKRRSEPWHAGWP